MKLWGSRFESSTDAAFDTFGASIGVDAAMYDADIDGSVAHAKMLAATGIISAVDADAIVVGLEQLRIDIAAGRIAFDASQEDIHMAVETLLTERIGEAGRRLHTARSRNDQVATDFRLHTRGLCDTLTKRINELISTICNISEQHVDSVMPGYTHLQRAQPTTFAHSFMAYAEMFLRDLDRLADARKRANISPLGACAMGATTYPIDREMTAAALGFDAPSANSIDAVSDRDFAIEYLAALSICAMHMSRMCEELIFWSSSEFGFVTMSDAYSTGSSIMPQKKNPDACELIRGKTGRVYGSLVTLLTVMKSLPLAYNKDMQEDKECVFDAFTTVTDCAAILNGVAATMAVNTDRLREAAQGGFIAATDAADYLVTKGVAFRDAYDVAGRIVKYCIQNNRTLETLTIDEYQSFHSLFDSGIYDAIDLLNCVRRRTVYGGPAPETVAAHIRIVRLRMSNE